MNNLPKKVLAYGGILLVAVFVVAASLWYRNHSEAEVTSSSDIQNEVVVQTETDSQIDISKETDTYTVQVDYPSVPTVYEGSKEANTYIRNLFEKRVLDFEHDMNDTASRDSVPTELKQSGVVSYYDITSNVVASTTRYISFFVSGETYVVGQAHPSHSVDTFIFDIKNKKLVTTAELFSASSFYVKMLSDLAKEDFSIRDEQATDADGYVIDITKDNEGFNPTKENFSKVLPTPDGLIIYFDEYQIAPYVAGPQQSIIPYVKLKQVINKDGVLGEYVK